jgi:hypothetical protein
MSIEHPRQEPARRADEHGNRHGENHHEGERQPGAVPPQSEHVGQTDDCRDRQVDTAEQHRQRLADAGDPEKAGDD